MNLQRYLMPAIIAASLHTSLAYFFSDRYPPPPPLPKEPPVKWEDTQTVQIVDPEPETGEPGAGKADPLPAQVEVKPVTEVENIFKIDVRTSAAPIKPVMKLPENPFGSNRPGEFGGPGGPPSLPSVVHLDRVPRATVQPAPIYPAGLRDTSGTVTVEFVVDTSGRVVSAEAVRWSHREFVDPAVRAVLRWRFEPGTINARKVSFRMAVPIEFNAER